MELPVRALVCIAFSSAIVGGYIESKWDKSNQTVSTVDAERTTTNKKKTVTKEIVAVDGSRVVNTETTEDITQHDTILKKIIEAERREWLVVGGATLDRSLYMLSVSRRVLGPINLGIWGLSNGQIGAVVAIPF